MQTNQLKSGIILSYVSMILQALILMVYTPIMLRLLGQSEYGLYTLVFSVVNSLSILNFGFGSTFVRYYSRYKAEENTKDINSLNGMFLIIFLAIGFVSLLVGLLLIFNTEKLFLDGLNINEMKKAKLLMTIMVFNLSIMMMSSVFDSIITANERFLFQRLLKLIGILLNPIVVLPLLLMGFKSVALVLVSTFINILTVILSIWYCLFKLNTKFSFKNFDFNLLKEMLIFSFFIFLNALVDQINWNVDKFLLGRYVNSAAVAVYGVASQINGYFLSVSVAISSVFIVRINHFVVKENDLELNNLFIKIGRLQFYIMFFLLSAFWIFGKYFIYMWAGKEYLDSYYILIILLTTVTIPLIQNLGIEILRAKNQHKFRSIVYISITILNLIISIFLCKKFGAIGCAIGTGLAIVLGNIIIINIYYHKKANLDMIKFWKNILRIIPAFIFPLLLGLLIYKVIIINSVFKFLLFSFIYSIVYFISVWCFSFNNYEKTLIKSFTYKFYKKLNNN